MTDRGRYPVKDDDRVPLARRLTACFDAGQTNAWLPSRLVPHLHSICQDIWRALRDLCGFAPAVDAHVVPLDVHVKVGRQVAGCIAIKTVDDRLRATLEDAARRTCRVRCAR